MAAVSAGEEGQAYEAVIGLEVHAQLATRSKLFCGCATRYGAPPNSQVCPTCLGLPGALPAPNAAAIELAAKVGLALGCALRPVSAFARKSYFYPDLPKGYQITQAERPLHEGGELLFPHEGATKKARLRRIHVEEDAAKNLHGVGSFGGTAVDFNRAGVPLIEIVGEPELRSGSEAEAYLRALRELLLYLGASDGQLEEGSLRCDANVSLRLHGSEALGPRAELKNLNSMRLVRRAIDAEVARQRALLRGGEALAPETRAYDEARDRTVLLRPKEPARDYRYFPDPDLPEVVLDAERVAALRASLPELPAARRRRWIEALGVPEEAARVLGAHPALASYLEESVALLAKIRNEHPSDLGAMVSNFIRSELLGQVELRGLEAAFPISAEALAGLLALVRSGTLSGRLAKVVYAEMRRSGRSAAAVVAAEGLAQITDEAALARVVEETISAHPAQVEAYRAGKSVLLGFFVGQAMKATQGSAHPERLRALLEERLSGWGRA